jgi:quinol monooxygenase YgiN
VIQYTCRYSSRGGVSMQRFVNHVTVPSYEHWHKAFQEGQGARKAAGCTAGKVFQNANNSNEVVILMEWESTEQVQAFISSPQVKAMIAAATGGAPFEGFLLTPVEG